MYNDPSTRPSDWPTLIRYPRSYPVRRLHLLWFLAFATIALALSVIALIIVFAVESAWFQDSFDGTWRYGLWRVCVNSSRCESWFSTGTDQVNQKIQQRLNRARPGINAWQALEIIFLFLTTATLFILILALIFFRYRRSIHYYLIILGTFCVWPAVCIGISVLFVFGFSVYHVADNPKDLEWCFYVNLVAVILAIIAAILLTIYDILFKRPLKKAIDDDDAVIERFPDLNGYPDGLNPSTFVIVRRNKKKRDEPYGYPTVLYPSNSPPPVPIANGHVAKPTHTVLTPYTSVISTQESTTTQTNAIQPTVLSTSNQRLFVPNRPDLVPSASLTTFDPAVTTYRVPVPVGRYPSNAPAPPLPPPPNTWNPNGLSTVTRPYAYHTDSYQPPYQTTAPFYPTRSEPRVLHYYTGYDYFATIDPSDGSGATRTQPQIIARPGTAIRYNSNPTYYPSNDYIKSTM